MRLRLGSVPVIVISSPDVAREVLQTQATAFLSRPRTSAVTYALFGSLAFSFAPYSPQWRLVRQLCATHLLSNKSLESMKPIIANEVEILVRSVYEDTKLGEVSLLPRVKFAANNIISRMAFGKRFSELVSSDQTSPTNFGDLLQEVVYLLGVFNIGDFIAFLQWLDLQGFVKRMKAVGTKLSAICQEILDVRREGRGATPGPPKDVLDVLMSVSEDSQQRVVLTDNDIKGIGVDLFAAGTDTTSMTVEWGLAEVLRNPAIMKKLQQELDDIVGNERIVQDSDMPQLPYLRAVVKETLRLHPALAMAARESTQACRIHGCDIPTKTPVFLNIWAIGRDAGEWEKPLEFRPERFLESEVDVRGHHFQLLPFGSGRRGCPGMMLGLGEVQLILANLLHAFDWLPQVNMNMAEKPGLVVGKAEPLLAKATPRLPLHLY